MHEVRMRIYPFALCMVLAVPVKASGPPVAENVATLAPNLLYVSHSDYSPIGRAAPPVQFQLSDGNRIALESYRGKPVLLDFWATWCGPCVLAMPNIERLYSLANQSGLTVISIDEDNDAKAAAAYLARHEYAWTNYHDLNGRVRKAFRDDYIPLTVLIDAQGKVAYYDSRSNDEALRAAIAKLGPASTPVFLPGHHLPS
jgi:thiol-disulfide isomerase/thioredoxin